MRRFVDLCINPPLNNDETIGNISNLVKILGLTLVGIIFDRNILQDRMNKIIEGFNELGIDVAKRIDLSPRTRIELLKDLRRLRGKYEIISVNCVNTKVSVVASRDRRVDIISIGYRTPITNLRRMISRITDKPLEIKISEILNASIPRTVALRRLHEEIFIAERNKVPIIISSGARNHLMLRSPRDMAALGVLLGLDIDEALESVSKVPYSIIKRNRDKLSAKWIAEGIQVIRGPKK